MAFVNEETLYVHLYIQVYWLFKKTKQHLLTMRQKLKKYLLCGTEVTDQSCHHQISDLLGSSICILFLKQQE